MRERYDHADPPRQRGVPGCRTHQALETSRGPPAGHRFALWGAGGNAAGRLARHPSREAVVIIFSPSGKRLWRDTQPSLAEATAPPYPPGFALALLLTPNT